MEETPQPRFNEISASGQDDAATPPAIGAEGGLSSLSPSLRITTTSDSLVVEPSSIAAGLDGRENHGTGSVEAEAKVRSGALAPVEIKKLSGIDLSKGAERVKILRVIIPLWDLHSFKELAEMTGVSAATICRLKKKFGPSGADLTVEMLTAEALSGNKRDCGRRPKIMPTAEEVACVREIFVKLDQSEARGRGLGSSIVTAFRLAAKGNDPRISELFKSVVLNRKYKKLPPSWSRLLQTSIAVLEHGQDKRALNSKHISTPRNRTIVDADGNETALRCGSIFEADDGTLNFYAYIPWPFGGDKCSEKYGVRLGRWQLLAVVDVHSELCVAFDVVQRNLSSYRGEDAAALLGRTMIEEAIPDMWRLERGSWESEIVRGALKVAQVHVHNAWHSKQKSAVERFFNRLWTPASMIPGHVGRDRGRYKHTTDLALACGEGRRDPRDHFLALDAAMPKLMNAIQFANTEPVESRSGWGIWTPQDRWIKQTSEHPLVKLDESMRVLFSREQKIWKVRKACLGGSVEGPLVRFPTYFQCAELAHFEGCRVKCYFDPYADEVLGTLVLQDAWAGYPAGHIIASNVPALDLPPQAVIAEDWAGEAEHAKSLAIRKAIAKSVRTEYCNWSGKRTSEARDGMGNIARKTQSQAGIINHETHEKHESRTEGNGGHRRAATAETIRSAIEIPYSLRRIMADQAETHT